MSVVRCCQCDRLVDSDFDCECFVEGPDGDEPFCESCRDRLGRHHQPRAAGAESFAAFVARMEASQCDNPEECGEG